MMLTVSPRVPAAVLTLTTLALILTLLGNPLGVLSVVVGVPFVLVAPGYSLLVVLFGTCRLSRLNQFVLSLVLSIAVLVLGGLLLNFLPSGLDARSWACYLWLLTLVCWGWAAVRLARRRAIGPQASIVHIGAGMRSWCTRATSTVGRHWVRLRSMRPERVPASTWHTLSSAESRHAGLVAARQSLTAFAHRAGHVSREWGGGMIASCRTWRPSAVRGVGLLAMALAVTGVAVHLAVASAKQQPAPGYTELWMLQSTTGGAPAVAIGIASAETTTETFTLDITTGNTTIQVVHLTLVPGKRWQHTYPITTGYTAGIAPVAATLVRDAQPLVVYRSVHVDVVIPSNSISAAATPFR